MPQAEHGGVGRPADVLVRAAELETWWSAAEALRSAHHEAQVIVASSEAVRDAARRRGYAEGAEQAARLVSRAAAAEAARLDLIEAALPGLVADAVARILGSFDVRALIAPAVSQALGQLRLGASATLRVAPGCAEPLRALLLDIGGGAVRLEPDPALADGCCVLSSELGDVELGVEAQLRALRQGLAAGWAEQAGS